jgi:hypothetical protein
MQDWPEGHMLPQKPLRASIGGTRGRHVRHSPQRSAWFHSAAAGKQQ